MALCVGYVVINVAKVGIFFGCWIKKGIFFLIGQKTPLNFGVEGSFGAVSVSIDGY
jgi:hypothetical protein